MNVVMDDYNRKLEGYEMRRLQRMGPSGASLTHTGSARELQHMGSSLSSNQPSNASSPPTLRISPAGLPALHKGAIPPAHRHHHRPHSRSSAPDTTNGFGTRLQRMGSSTTDSPSPQPQTFVSSMTVPVGAYRPAPAHGGSALQLAGLPPGPAVHRAGSHGRLEGAPASIRGGHEPPREMREPRGSRPSRAGSQSSRAGSQSVLTRMESGESEPPATSRSASTSHLPLRSTSISSLNSSESYPSQEQQSHFSLRSAHSHHSVRSLGGASQQLSLSALLPQPGMSPPLDDWGADRESPLSGAGFWRCIMACHSKVGQQIARKRVEQGIKLFNQQRHQEAVAKWKEALRKIRREQDRFITLGYLCQAYMHWGKYRELVELAFQQLDIAHSMEDNLLRAEAYLNLARGNERMGSLDSALQYCRHSLYSQCDQSRTTGQVHLCLGNIYVTYSNFSKAIEHYELALKVARSIRDVGLELLIYVGMGQVFNVLKDYNKGLQLVAKAFELSKSFQICDLNMRHQRLALLHLVTPLRKLGRMSEAYECCQDALRMALEAGDRPLNARGLCAMGDILRQKSDGQRAYRRYEAALQMLTDMEDAFGRVLALDGMAKSISLLCRQKKVCDCKPLEAYTRLLDAVTNCGSKLLLRNTHQHLSGIYAALGDDENARLQERLASVLTEEMELYCAVCNQPLGQEPGNSLEALPCSHIFHQQCARELLSKSDRRKKKRICPQCRKTVNSRMMFVCYDDVKYDGHYPAFLANNTTHVQTPDHPL